MYEIETYEEVIDELGVLPRDALLAYAEMLERDRRVDVLRVVWLG